VALPDGRRIAGYYSGYSIFMLIEKQLVQYLTGRAVKGQSGFP
jgi:hypothetical protein